MRKVLLVLTLLASVVAVASVAGGRWVLDQVLPAGVHAEPAPSPSAATASSHRVKLIAHVEPDDQPDGIIYHVTPTRAGRLAMGADLDAAWEQAVALGVPRRSSLRYQFLCHPLSLIARAKTTWDLEAWRPNVGQWRTMLAGCDPV